MLSADAFLRALNKNVEGDATQWVLPLLYTNDEKLDALVGDPERACCVGGLFLPFYCEFSSC